MRIFVASLLLFLAETAFAQKKLSQDAFVSNVKPVLHSIINDFYQMVSQFQDFPKELTQIVEQTNRLSSEKEELRLACPRVLDKNCLKAIDGLREKMRTIEVSALELLARQKIESGLYLNSIGGLRVMGDFHNDLTEIKGNLDNSSFLIRARIFEKFETFTVIKKIDELQTLLSLAVVEYVPYGYREDFRNFFFNFVHPIEIQVSKNNNYEFLNRNLNNLNFAINLLNMNLTKRNKKTPEGMAQYLALIHNRWNGILRYYM